MLTTPQTSLDPSAAAALQGLDPDLVIVVGGEVALTADVFQAVEAAVPGADVRRVFGLDRYATAGEIAAIFADLGLSAAFQPTGNYVVGGQSCAAGQVVTGFAADGSPTCEAAAASLPTTVPAGRTITGLLYLETENGSSGDYGALLSFPIPMPSAVATHYLSDGDSPTTNCPGSTLEPKARPGHLCIYEDSNVGTTGVPSCIWDLVGTSACDDPVRNGAFVRWLADGSAGDMFVHATWAATAPN